jgi:4a-hydroxytetrahydrobiopterin dehydratase
MARVQALSPEAIEAHLQQLSGWSVVNGKLHRELTFQNFVEAFGFMTKVALVAESADHHPEWRNVYRNVVIDLATHAAGDAISARDIELAQKINQLLDEAS